MKRDKYIKIDNVKNLKLLKFKKLKLAMKKIVNMLLLDNKKYKT